jgi:hypothetical protein
MIICPARTAATASSIRANGELFFFVASESGGLPCDLTAAPFEVFFFHV